MKQPAHPAFKEDEVLVLTELVQPITYWDTSHRVSMLRLDRLQTWASGNKYFKLLHFIRFALENRISHIVSKGGMFSNHLDALAQACQYFNLTLTCVVRSNKPDEQNPIIKRIQRTGALIVWVTPDVYDAYGEEKAFVDFPGALFIPEGGLHQLGISGSIELGNQLAAHKADHILVMGGSMCTAIGVLAALDDTTQLHIIPAWKGCSQAYVHQLLESHQIMPACAWHVWPDFHSGGFGKWDMSLFNTMMHFTQSTGIPLDPVYTGKLVLATQSMLNENVFASGSGILLVHTGGLQGVEGYAYRFPDPWKAYHQVIGNRK